MTAAGDGTGIRRTLAGYMPALDGIRGVAILLVVWHNAGLAGGRADTLLGKLFVAGANAGWIGVQFFFVLSGFLITGILLDARGRPHAWSRFMARRALRIFPVYYAALAIGFLLFPAVGRVPVWLAHDLEHQAWYWTYLVNWSSAWGLSGPGFAHFWSLAVEEQYYLVWPLLVLLLAPRRLGAVCIALMLIAVGFRLSARAIMPSEYAAVEGAYAFTISRFDALAVGGLLALVLREAAWTGRLVEWARTATVAVTAALIAFAVSQRGLSVMHWPVMIYGQSLVALLGALLVLLAALPGPTGAVHWVRWLESRPLRAIGKYSYAIYVAHLPVAHALKPLLPEDLDSIGGLRLPAILAGQVLLVFIVSVGVALVSWHMLEAPALQLRRRLRQGPVGCASS